MASTKPASTGSQGATEEPVQPSRQLRAKRRAPIARSPSVARPGIGRQDLAEWVRRRIVHHRAPDARPRGSRHGRLVPAPHAAAVVRLVGTCQSRLGHRGGSRGDRPRVVRGRRPREADGHRSACPAPAVRRSARAKPVAPDRVAASTRVRGGAATRPRRTQLTYVHDELEGDGNGPSIRWALATGYLSVLSSLHRAEEALIVVEPTDAVVGDALHDALSLEDFAIDNSDRLLRNPARRHRSAEPRPSFSPGLPRRRTAADEPSMSRRLVRHSVRSGSPSTSTSRTSWAASCVPGTGSSGRCSPSASRRTSSSAWRWRRPSPCRTSWRSPCSTSSARSLGCSIDSDSR